jgi:type I restriction enzyme M protein
VPKGGGFKDMIALKGNKEIGDKINKIIGKLAQANDLKGVIDVADFNDADKLGKGKEMQDRLSNLVSIFENPYDVYQHLMSYWSDTMQDDVYMLVSDGWKAQTDGKPNIDLIPQHLIVNRYFAAERESIVKLEAERDEISRRMEEMDEEQGIEDGLLFEAKTEKGKLTKVSVNACLKELKLNKEDADERKALEAYAALIEKESIAGKKVKEAQKILDVKVAAQYAKLSENETKTLVVDGKWLATISTDVQTELDRVSQALTGRIKQLAERYATPLLRITEEVEVLSGKVDGHLKKMGFVWS